MASSLVSEGSTLRIEPGRSRWAPFAAFPLFCGAFYMFVAAAMGVGALAARTDRGFGEYFSVLLFFTLALALSGVALMIACARLFLIDKARGEVSRIFRFGPLKWRNTWKLSTFSLIEVDTQAESDDAGPTYFVKLSGGAGSDTLRIASFDARGPANALARELGKTVDLPVSEVAGKRR